MLQMESKLKQVAYASCIISAFLPWAAQAGTQVYPGCAVPNPGPGHHTFFVDPVKGSPKGDGSAAKPWRTLAEVLDPASKLLSTQGHKTANDMPVAINATGPIKPGDVLMLMSGNHGSVKVFNAYNTDFVSVMAAPGQAPVVNELTVNGSAKWVFQGIKFQGEDPARPTSFANRGLTNLVWVGNSYLGSSSNVVFTNNSFSTTDDTSKWSSMDWLLKPYNQALYNYADCLSVVQNKFYNIMNGIGTQGPHTLIADNTIDKFSNDAIDFQTGDITIRGNTITGSVSPIFSPLHPDAMQGLTKIVNGIPQVQGNVLIEDNIVIKNKDSGGMATQAMQGIDNFGSGHWTDVIVRNNVVATNAWHGITFGNVDRLHIVNNTVLATNPGSVPTWINVGIVPNSGPTSDVVVRNNLSPQIVVEIPTAQVDHNYVNSSFTLQKVMYKQSMQNKNMVILPSLVSDFVQPNVAAPGFDARLRPKSSVIGTGSSVLAPTDDLAGAKRSNPVSPGAYNAVP